MQIGLPKNVDRPLGPAAARSLLHRDFVGRFRGAGTAWWVVAISATTRTRDEVERSAEPPCQAVSVGVRRQSPRVRPLMH
jgi:hypothetical protein